MKDRIAELEDTEPSPDPDPEPEPEPEPEPSGNWPAFPEASRFGTVINEYINAPPTPGAFQRQSTPHIDGASANDPFLVRKEETGLWAAHGKSSPLTHSLEHITPVAPPQSVYDRGVRAFPQSSTASTRCQLQKWSNGSAFWTGHNGDHVFLYFGFKVMPNPPIAKKAGEGAPGQTQLVQWKARSEGGYSEVDSINVGSNGITFEFSSHPGNVEERFPITDVPHGLWHRVVVETVVATPNGKMAMWIQPNGKPWRKVTERTVGTIPGTSDSNYRNIGVGPYHQILATTNNRLYSCRYAGIQMFNAK